MRRPEGGGARDTLPGGPGRNRQRTTGTGSVLRLVDTINHVRRPSWHDYELIEHLHGAGKARVGGAE